MPTTNYEEGVIAWSERQAALLRGGWGELLDIDNIAEEIEEVGNCYPACARASPRRISSRMSGSMP